MKPFFILTLLFTVVLLSGCFPQPKPQLPPDNTAKIIQPNLPNVEIQEKKEDDVMDKKEDVMMKEDDKMMQDKQVIINEEISFSGTVLAGTSTPFLDFNQADYEKALAANKKIVLYFYASWCPICREEIKDTYAAFNALNDTNIVGFRVNYNDSDTDKNEENVAREFGVAYQHTKVFLKDGQRILKAPNTWSKDDYLSQIKQHLQ